MSLAAPPDITLRPLTDADLPLLHAWLNHPALAPWWGDAGFTMAEVEAGYRPATLLADGVMTYLALLDGVPFAYAQHYVAMGAGDGWWAEEADPGVRGIDLFIASPDHWGRGLGTRLVQVLVDGLFADPAVTRVQADPSPQNPRAIRCLEKAGFRRAREIVTPDGPAVYLLRDRHPV